jgi:hypothetical protein
VALPSPTTLERKRIDARMSWYGRGRTIILRVIARERSVALPKFEKCAISIVLMQDWRKVPDPWRTRYRRLLGIWALVFLAQAYPGIADMPVTTVGLATS